jgi:hypothetical protein
MAEAGSVARYRRIRGWLRGPRNAGIDSQQSELLQMRAAITALIEEVRQSRADLSRLTLVVGEVRDIAGVHFDRTPEQRQRLLEARASPEYLDALVDSEPLVSVRIPTYDRAEILFDRTLPSVLAQTYSRLEVIIVGDGCSAETIRRAEAVTDPRVRFVNLPHRGVYPDDAERRWLVAGSPAMNHGAQMALGQWIAPLDDDDEFMPDHIETLLSAAQGGAFEMVYGRMRVVPADAGERYEIGCYPPAHSQFGFQAALYMSAIRFFEYETSSWVLGEPGDWNLCRRMMAAGVRIGYTEKVVTTLYPAGPQ